MSLFDDASLVLIPDGAKDGKLYSVKPTDGTGDFTFTRGSNLAATRVDENGLIEKGRENLLKYSNAFTNAPWGGGGTWTPNQLGRDGQNNAWTLTKSGASNSDTYNELFSGLQTFSIYVKKDDANKGLSIYNFHSAGNLNASYNLSTGILQSATSGVIHSSLVEYNSTWWRMSVTANVINGQWYIYTTDGTSTLAVVTVTLQDAQLEVGLVATDYIETGATTAQAGILEDMPRLDYSGGATCPSLLLEPSRTQLVGQSEYFDGSYWPKADVVVTNNAAISPDGKLNASKLIASATNANHLLNKPGFLGITSGQSYTFSIFAKAAEYDFVRLQFQTGPFPVNYANFDLTNGTIGLNTGTTDTKIESFGNGWYKCIMVVTATSTANSGFQPFVLDSDRTGTSPSYLGDGTSGIYIWGAQCEQASYATSYIPTYGTSVTRGQDACIKLNYPDLSNQQELTLYTEFNYEQLGRVIAIGDGTVSYRFFVSYDNDKRIFMYLNVGGLVFFRQSSSNVLSDGINKVAVKIKSGETILYVNGTQIFNDTNTFTLSNMQNIYVGTLEFSGANNLQKINSSLVFYAGLTDGELATLTTL